MSNSKEYTFDVKLFASFNIEASSEKEARDVIEQKLFNDILECNRGAWPDGNPILFTASADNDSPELIAIDGEDV